MHEFNPIFKRQRPGVGQRRIFAEAQSRGRDDLADDLRIAVLDRLKRRQPRDEQSRLADIRRIQLLSRAVGANLKQIVTQNRRRPVKERPGRRQPGANLPAHADQLSTLPGEEERDLHFNLQNAEFRMPISE